MYRFSNTVIGFLNLFTLLASIPIIGAGLWMARSSTTCESFLQTPLLVVGFIILIISLTGFIGACFHVAWAIWVYLLVMIFLIGALIALTIFGFAVTSQSGGLEVPGRMYKEYHLDNYSPWLRKRIKDPHYWMTTCLLFSPVAANRRVLAITWARRWRRTLIAICGEMTQPGCATSATRARPECWKRAETDHPYDRNRMSKIHPRWDFHWWRRWHDWRHQIY
ncbi:unnamed protein product [Fraxinus pennsylvanica]|uniref:Tetraspanin-6 n=1 Tax=Fraxinus pennsylvanica TaxID=56036 RepID=A0AAD1ZMI3_9LAMI|nr:unnamed protein product [Fraxinus pennsylvanica]